MPRVRSIIYIDGYNFYYGMVRDTEWKWLDLQRCFELVRSDDDIQEIRYFTSEALGDARERQSVYLEALGTLPLVTVHLGRFKGRSLTCRVRACEYAGSRRYQVLEEKETDVAISVRLIDDAYRDRADRFVIVSGDSDLVPAVRLLRERFADKEIIVYVPASAGTRRAAAREMRRIAHKHRTMPVEPLRRSQLPEVIPVADGTIRKPPSW
ncbi:MAG: NYN domain-containing protein [Chloroflexi bacterium]|nr:NYN domain-containing protein [Chloroflexota bacterium]